MCGARTQAARLHERFDEPERVIADLEASVARRDTDLKKAADKINRLEARTHRMEEDWRVAYPRALAASSVVPKVGVYILTALAPAARAPRRSTVSPTA